jgi:hypothetical protein
MARRRGSTVTVNARVDDYLDVDVDLDELLEEVETKELIEELKRRNASADLPPTLDLDWLRSLILARDTHGALAYIERVTMPVVDRKTEYEKWKASVASA